MEDRNGLDQIIVRSPSVETIPIQTSQMIVVDRERLYLGVIQDKGSEETQLIPIYPGSVKELTL